VSVSLVFLALMLGQALGYCFIHLFVWAWPMLWQLLWPGGRAAFWQTYHTIMNAAPLHLKWRAAWYAFTGLRSFR
jgi:hypothetical protein